MGQSYGVKIIVPRGQDMVAGDSYPAITSSGSAPVAPASYNGRYGYFQALINFNSLDVLS